jgi:hypothetical protein
MGLLCQFLAIYGGLFTALTALIARQENLAEISHSAFFIFSM